ncbi:alcohol dehydrogenase-like 6 [Dorcoceras hygrometricum]|uniref:Alcohol dehydrogenase-like 6 n=1 Tax=Dorcoceras hygrometricum TaxID=472368 RepID=A0A2Z7CEZ6_9LAMI|nr:alcohol dehydrogenase-like 6 [Dorcoceras hygrometricum]
MRAAGLASSLRSLLVDIAFSVILNEKATHVSQHFGVLTIGFSSFACEESVARAVNRYDDVDMTYSLLLVVDCVVMVTADQQACKCKSVEKRRRLN